ncbi:MAG TPA: NTP transferase domain-containing protein [Candidatus Faecousia intestinigallinarum]|nr:NTP transferase domain-containing protein [Candidatus Faecousia intestinigallinarum]
MQKKEFDILVALAEGAPLTQRTLAEKTGLSVGSVNKTMKELTEQGWLVGGRVTEKGREALEPYRVKRAIFLAAGFGSRMVPITFNTPKPLVRVHGTRMIDTLLDAVVAAGIPEIVVVRGYLGEQFDQLLYKYPQIKFVENPIYNEANNISSAMCVRYLFQNAYVLEADLVLHNPKLIRKYEYASNFLGIPVEVTDDWCFHTDSNGMIVEQSVGGRNCYQMVGISYWDAEAGVMLANDLNEVYTSPGGKERYWEQTALVYKKEHYRVAVRECAQTDIVEIDSFNELKKLDSLYAK